MSEFSRETLLSIIETDHVQCGEASALARLALAAMDSKPVENYIGSKNALDAIVSFIKGKSNPTVKFYEEVSEQLFKDNCHGIHSHVIEYILKLGEELEDLRAEQAEMQPAPVVPDAYVRDEGGRMMLNGVCEPKIGFGTGWNACRAAMLQELQKSAGDEVICRSNENVQE